MRNYAIRLAALSAKIMLNRKAGRHTDTHRKKMAQHKKVIVSVSKHVLTMTKKLVQRRRTSSAIRTPRSDKHHVTNLYLRG